MTLPNQFTLDASSAMEERREGKVGQGYEIKTPLRRTWKFIDADY